MITLIPFFVRELQVRAGGRPAYAAKRAGRTGTTIAKRTGMNTVTAISPGDAYPSAVDRSRRNNCHIRVLRWTFRRDRAEAVVCELALTGEDREYELRAPAEWNPTGRAVERFDDALTAFQRHAMIERCLLDDGWELDTFESERVTVH
jgi:monoamine oxidase